MTLLQFPADRRAADVRRCARTLNQLQGEEANRFWRSEMAQFAQSFRSQGLAEEDIRNQAALFMHAVQMELQSAYASEDVGVRA